MGSGLGRYAPLAAALFGVALIGMLPVHDAHAARDTKAQRAQKLKKAKSVAPVASVAPAFTPTPGDSLALTGTYALISIATRQVRDADLAKSRVTFGSAGAVSVETACNNFATTLQARPKPTHILGFSQIVPTTMGCVAGQSEAEATTARLFRETANIARAGNTITFFSSTGVNIAQWSLIAASQEEVSAPQPGAPAPVRADYGDYVLTELNGNRIAALPARPVPTPPGASVVSEASPTTLPVDARAVSSTPSLSLSANGNAMGSGGCNQFNTSLIEIRNGTKRFGPLVTTKKACLNTGASALEAQLFNTMRTASRVDVGPRRVDLYARNGARTARFSSISARAQAGPSLYGPNWILRSINGAPIPQTSPPAIKFEGDVATGSTGCNRFSIQHDRQNGRSRFSNGVTTKMACLDNGRNALESHFMAALNTITMIEVSPTTLTLRSTDLRTVLVFDAQ